MASDWAQGIAESARESFGRYGELVAALSGSTAPADPRDEKIAEQRQEIARLQATVARIVYLPREPAALPDEHAPAYLRGWQDARSLVDKALLPEDGQT